MHRTEGDGYVDEDGKRRHIDQNLPTIPGTTGSAEFFNACQEELINAIEYAGLTIEPDAADDRSAGWVQLKQAIFESAAIDTAALAASAVTNAKVSDVSISKLTSGIFSDSVSAGGYDYISLYAASSSLEFQFRKDNTSTNVDEATGFTHAGYYCRKYDTGSLIESIVLDYDRFLMNDESVSGTIRQLYYDSETLYITKNIISSADVYTMQLKESNGFTHKQVQAGTTTVDSVNLSYVGVKYLRSNYAMQHMIIACDTGWTGSGPWLLTKTVTNLPADATVLDMSFSMRITSSKETYFIDNSSTYVPTSLRIDMNASPPIAYISSPLNPATCDRIYLTIWFTREIT